MDLSNKQKKYLKGLGHKLSAVVAIGKNEVSQGVIKVLEEGLDCHELIKVKAYCDNQEEMKELTDAITESVRAQPAGVLGIPFYSVLVKNERLFFRASFSQVQVICYPGANATGDPFHEYRNQSLEGYFYLNAHTALRLHRNLGPGSSFRRAALYVSIDTRGSPATNSP